ncbi:aldo/keto reductase [Agromyces archimandritae]|uniref:Aldo/keto reductase n=1 Tax=Agromyces archimandritae TaxID=2781962 RepID=A0A975FMF9_9MICO|nr:aldo/keto reductase [Agromyces archimandritae]QTX05145.1 aldo/keto reductase [Agromyces archimandritae]
MADLEYRSLGRSGLRVSAVGLGGNNFGRRGTATESPEGTRAVLDAALAAGVNLIDTADVYGKEYGLSESLLGEALQGRRDEVVIATKFGHAEIPSPLPDWGSKGSRRYIRLAVEGSLRRLKTDWIDLYQLHTPDPATPIAETLAALDELVREGKVRYIGHSNLAGWQIAEAALTAELAATESFISAQNEYSLIVRDAEAEVLPAARAFGVGFLPYFPLRAGLLTGKFTREGGPDDSRIMRERRAYFDAAPWDALDRYAEWCREHGVAMLEATFGWMLAQDGLTSVIAGATRPEQIEQNVRAGSWRPSADEAAEIDAIFG